MNEELLLICYIHVWILNMIQNIIKDW
jgi:hypothetical protein